MEIMSEQATERLFEPATPSRRSTICFGRLQIDKMWIDDYRMITYISNYPDMPNENIFKQQMFHLKLRQN
jgi:hypothetical protein